MSLADRLAAARDARSDELPPEDLREPGAGLPEVDHTIPDPVSPVASAVAAADAVARGTGKRRADVPAAVGPNTGGTAQPGSTPRTPPVGTPDPSMRRGFVSTAQSDRIEELKSSVHVQLLQQMGPRL